MELKKNVKNENSTHELEFVIDAAALSEAASLAYKKTAKKYKVPGFRPGKAPRHLIEQMYGKEIFTYDALNDLFPAEYEAAVTEAGIEPVGRPETNVVSADMENGAVLNIVVPVKPDVALGEYKGLKAEKEVHTVEDEAVEAEIERMRLRNARTITKEDKAENGDVAVFDFEGFVDGEAFEGGKAENYSLELGSGQFIPGFEEQLVDHAAGEEFDLTVSFPEDYAAKELAGKEAVFKIKMHEVKTKEMPEVDDEFAKDVSEYDTLADLRASIAKEMQAQMDHQAELEAENKLMDQVVEGMQAIIPECMYEDEIDTLVNDFAYRMQGQGLKLDDYLKYTNSTMDAFRATFKENAEKQVKMRLALEKIVELEQIEVSEEEFEAEAQRIADQYKMELDKVKSLLPASDVKKDLARNKAIDFVKTNAAVTEGAKEEKKAPKKAKKAESEE